MHIPEYMNAVRVENPGGPFVVRTVKTPVPGKGEVLIKIAAAPVNPSDLQRIRSIADPALIKDFIPGIEGSGIVVAAGSGILPRVWLGKRVACSSHYPSSGTWAEYMVTTANHCFPLPDSINDEQGAMLLVNPMTAVAFFDIIRKEKHKAVVNAAAAGALGGMVRALGKRHGVSVINIVRSEEQVKLIDSMYVVNSSDPGFPDKLKELALELNATIAFDPVAGSFTQKLLDAMPYGSTVVIYGNLSASEEGTNLRPLLTQNKKLHGFYLANWSVENGLAKTLINLLKVRRLIISDITVPVQNRFPFNKTQLAIDTYLSDMTAGKVLLTP
jgi:NADPH:quinone reductase